MRAPRSWLFAPGHNEKLLSKVFDAGADVVLLDLEDAVPLDMKDRARSLVLEVATSRPCWIRVNRPMTDLCASDLAAVAGVAFGLRLPKVETAAEVAWAAERAPGRPLDCTIETARGVLAAFDIANSVDARSLSYGGLDLALDLGIPGGEVETLFARSSIVLSARAAGKPPPSDGVYPFIDDEDGLRRQAIASRRLGFFGKSAIHPRQIQVINEVFMTTADELAWANRVVSAYKASGGSAVKLSDGEFVDTAVFERARQLLALDE